MFGTQIWRTENVLIDFTDLLDEAKKKADPKPKLDTYPVGTVRVQGKFVYVKIGSGAGTKAWPYYATAGTEKANAAIAAGGVLVKDGKVLGPATDENCKKYGMDHPTKGKLSAGEAPSLASVVPPTTSQAVVEPPPLFPTTPLPVPVASVSSPPLPEPELSSKEKAQVALDLVLQQPGVSMSDIVDALEKAVPFSPSVVSDVLAHYDSQWMEKLRETEIEQLCKAMTDQPTSSQDLDILGELGFPPDTPEHAGILAILQSGGKIQAIKALRNLRPRPDSSIQPLGLKELKGIVDKAEDLLKAKGYIGSEGQVKKEKKPLDPPDGETQKILDKLGWQTKVHGYIVQLLRANSPTTTATVYADAHPGVTVQDARDLVQGVIAELEKAGAAKIHYVSGEPTEVEISLPPPEMTPTEKVQKALEPVLQQAHTHNISSLANAMLAAADAAVDPNEHDTWFASGLVQDALTKHDPEWRQKLRVQEEQDVVMGMAALSTTPEEQNILSQLELKAGTPEYAGALAVLRSGGLKVPAIQQLRSFVTTSPLLRQFGLKELKDMAEAGSTLLSSKGFIDSKGKIKTKKPPESDYDPDKEAVPFVGLTGWPVHGPQVLALNHLLRAKGDVALAALALSDATPGMSVKDAHDALLDAIGDLQTKGAIKPHVVSGVLVSVALEMPKAEPPPAQAAPPLPPTAADPEKEAELVSFLKSAGFDLPDKQQKLLASPVFTGLMNQKHGPDWFKKWKELTLGAGTAGGPTLPPMEEPPPPPAKVLPLVGLPPAIHGALTKAGYAETSLGWSVAALIHAHNGNTDTALDAHLAKGGSAAAFKALVQDLKADGVVSVVGNLATFPASASAPTAPPASAPPPSKEDVEKVLSSYGLGPHLKSWKVAMLLHAHNGDVATARQAWVSGGQEAENFDELVTALNSKKLVSVVGGLATFPAALPSAPAGAPSALTPALAPVVSTTPPATPVPTPPKKKLVKTFDAKKMQALVGKLAELGISPKDIDTLATVSPGQHQVLMHAFGSNYVERFKKTVEALEKDATTKKKKNAEVDVPGYQPQFQKQLQDLDALVDYVDLMGGIDAIPPEAKEKIAKKFGKNAWPKFYATAAWLMGEADPVAAVEGVDPALGQAAFGWNWKDKLTGMAHLIVAKGKANSKPKKPCPYAPSSAGVVTVSSSWEEKQAALDAVNIVPGSSYYEVAKLLHAHGGNIEAAREDYFANATWEADKSPSKFDARVAMLHQKGVAFLSVPYSPGASVTPPSPAASALLHPKEKVKAALAAAGFEATSEATQLLHLLNSTGGNLKAAQAAYMGLPGSSAAGFWNRLASLKNHGLISHDLPASQQYGIAPDKVATLLPSTGATPSTSQKVAPAPGPAAPPTFAPLGPVAGMDDYDLPLPPVSEFKKTSDTVSDGAGQHAIYVDAQGHKWFFRVAKNKKGTKVEPTRASVQGAFSRIARAIKPNHPLIHTVTLDGVLGTVHPYMPATNNGPPTLKGPYSPSKLTQTECADIAAEHVLDWIFSEHDSHGANFVRTPDGHIVAVDKEQGFKHFGPWADHGLVDQLSLDYHPNTDLHGEHEPYYNTFWRAWSQGQVDFDPMVLADTFQRLGKIPGRKYRENLRAYAQDRFPGDRFKQEQFLQMAVSRKNTAKRDFEKFLTGLYRTRTKTDGEFTFKHGWVPTGVAPGAPPKLPLQTKVVQHTSSEKLAEMGGKTVPYMAKPGEDPASAAKKITIKLSTSHKAEDLEKLLADLKVPHTGVKTGGNYHMVFVDKDAWEAASMSETVTIDPNPPAVVPGQSFPPYSTHDDPAYQPALRPHPPAQPNSEDLKVVHQRKNLGRFGARITLDAGAVEQQVAGVKRRKDAQGNVYYEVVFKLRPKMVQALANKGSSAEYAFPVGPMYDPAEDALLDGTKVQGEKFGSVYSESSRHFTSPTGDFHVLHHPGSGGKEHNWAMGGTVIARVRPQAGQSVHEALKQMLNSAHSGLGDQVVRDPTPEEREIVKLSKLLWAYAPQVHDQLPEADFTPDKLLPRLKAAGLSDEDIASAQEVETLDHQTTWVLPGRWRRDGAAPDGTPGLRYLYWNASNPARIVNMLRGAGAMGSPERILTGTGFSGTDGGSEMHNGLDGMTWRVATRFNDGQEMTTGYGDYHIIVPPDEIDRLDVGPLYSDDEWGCMNPSASHGGDFTHRKPLSKALTDSHYSSTSAEIVIRKGVHPKRILRVACHSEAKRQELLKQMRAAGLTEMNGMPIEEFVVVSANVTETHQRFVQAAGY